MFVLTSREMAETPQSAAAALPSRVMNVCRFMSVAGGSCYNVFKDCSLRP